MSGVGLVGRFVLSALICSDGVGGGGSTATLPPTEARAASITSVHVAKREASSLASACASTTSRPSGSSERSALAEGGASSRWACMTAMSVSRSNGLWPVRHSKRRQPNA